MMIFSYCYTKQQLTEEFGVGPEALVGMKDWELAESSALVHASLDSVRGAAKITASESLSVGAPPSLSVCEWTFDAASKKVTKSSRMRRRMSSLVY